MTQSSQVIRDGPAAVRRILHVARCLQPRLRVHHRVRQLRGNFGTTNAPTDYPRTVSVAFNDGPTFTADQTSSVYPQDVPLSPSGNLHFDAPVVSASAEIAARSFRLVRVLHALRRTGGVVSGIGGFGTWEGSWRYNFNYPASADTADSYRWTGSGACTGYIFGGTNPGGAYPRTVLFTDLAAGAAAALSPTPMVFPAARVGLSVTQSVTVRNSGGGLLVVRDASVLGNNAGDFLVASNGCAFKTLAPGATCAIAVTFRPVADGPRTSSLQVATNAPVGLSVIPLSGWARRRLASSPVG